MITAGVDIGTRFLKISIVDEETLLGFICRELKGDFKKLYSQAFHDLLETISLNKGRKVKGTSVKKTVVTGYGYCLLKKKCCYINESACTARGVRELKNEACTIIDAGGFFLRVIGISSSGEVEETCTNEKCATGSGKFLEMAAESVHVDIDKISEYAETATKPFLITNSCAVFAESDVISEVNRGGTPEDILAGVIDSIALKTMTLLESPFFAEPFYVTGGLSSIKYFTERLKQKCGRDVHPLEFADPRAVTSFGAALLARELNQ